MPSSFNQVLFDHCNWIFCGWWGVDSGLQQVFFYPKLIPKTLKIDLDELYDWQAIFS